MRRRSGLRRTVAVVAILAQCGGCTLQDAAKKEAAINGKIDRYKDERPETASREVVAESASPYFGSRLIRSNHGDELPPGLTSLRLTLRRSTPLSLERIAEAISRNAGNIAIKIEGRGGAVAIGGEGAPDAGASALLARANAAPGLPAPATPGGNGVSSAVLIDTDFAPDFQDASLESILDVVCQRFDCDWSYTGGVIVISRMQTRVFDVRADPSTKQITSEVSGATPTLAQGASSGGSNGGNGGSLGSGGGGSGDSGASNQLTSMKIDLDVWKEVNETLAVLVPPPGRFVAQRAAGVVTVVAPPATMRRVTTYFDELNRSLSARIAVEITAIYINTDNTDDFGMSLNALYKDAKTGVSYGLSDIVPAFDGSIGSANFAVSQPTSQFNGSTAVIKALAQSNRLADVQTGSIITQNGVPSTLNLTTNTDIIRSIQFSTIAQAGTATTAAQATTVPTGFSMQILPHIVGTSQISLIASVENSAIASETQQSVGTGSSLDLLTTTERNFAINVIVGSGEEIASLGYDQYTATRTQTGLGWVWNVLDGEQQAGLVRTRLLLLLRAVILKGPGTSVPDQPSPTAELFAGKAP